jgi:hypothetical protein
MQIIFHAADELNRKAQHVAFYRKKLSNLLQPIESRLTRVIVFLQDVNGSKRNGPDKQCVLECRIPGLAPLVIRTRANRYDQAVFQSALRARRRILERDYR